MACAATAPRQRSKTVGVSRAFVPFQVSIGGEKLRRRPDSGPGWQLSREAKVRTGEITTPDETVEQRDLFNALQKTAPLAP